MSRLLAFALLLALATPAAAEVYWLEPKSIEPIGRRFVLMRFGAVTLGPGEAEVVWLSLAGCPGGVDHVFAYYVQPLSPGEWDYAPRWAYPHSYKNYTAAVAIDLRNFSAEPMTFKLKLSVRCDQ